MGAKKHAVVSFSLIFVIKMLLPGFPTLEKHSLTFSKISIFDLVRPLPNSLSPNPQNHPKPIPTRPKGHKK